MVRNHHESADKFLPLHSSSFIRWSLRFNIQQLFSVDLVGPLGEILDTEDLRGLMEQ